MVGIYSIRNILNDKRYIGLSTDIEARFKHHINRLKTNTHRNEHLQNAFNTYGIDSFEFMILDECSPELLCDKEKYWIGYYQSYDRNFGYNKTYGGEFGRVSYEINEQRRIKLKNQIIPQEQRDKISKTLSGRIQDRDIVHKRANSCRKCDDETELLITRMYCDDKLIPRIISEKLNIKLTTIISVLKRKGCRK
jgi:group I intron endonuclease